MLLFLDALLTLPEDALVTLFGRSADFGMSSSMSDVSGVGWIEVLLLKTGETAVPGVPAVVERDCVGVRCCLDRAMIV